MAESAPVFITEFGPGPDGGSSVTQYVRDVLSTADSHNLHWTAWALFPFQKNAMVEWEWDPGNDHFPLTAWGRHIRDTLSATE